MTDTSAPAPDYVIVGAGLCGLVLASRLTEDSSVSVAVLEAGEKLIHDELIDTPGKLLQNLGNPKKDWAFFSVPQKGMEDRRLYLPRGKGVGGSTLINFLQLGRASAEEYDAFEHLGCSGWGWDALLPYLKKSENLVIDPKKAEEFGMNFKSEFHGTSGNVTSTFPFTRDQFAALWVEAARANDVYPNADNNAGNNSGLWRSLLAIDENATRVSAASAYYEPVAGRSNLRIITGARATRVITETSHQGIVAKGVEYVKGDSKVIINAKKEVILSAGSFQSPQLLELSGIGDAKVLKPLGIPIVSDLLGVGNNLQDHLITTYTAKLNPGLQTFDLMQDAEFAKQQQDLYDNERRGMLTATTSAFAFLTSSFVSNRDAVTSSATKFVFEKKDSVSTGVHQGLILQESWLKDDKVPCLEIGVVDRFLPGLPGLSPEPGQCYLSMSIILLHPFSRGSVHIGSSDPLANPEIDPNFLNNDIDSTILAEGFKFARRIAATQPLKEHIAQEVSPGSDYKTDEDLKRFICRTGGTSYHPVGTVSMLPKDSHGCVDTSLKVYGTSNLRVIDASIIPLQISAHIQATLYGLAEKAADMIKNGL